MSPLETLQQDFLAMLEGRRDFAVGASQISTEQSLRIYRRNYRENRMAALHDTYVRVDKMVGRDYFRQLARRYVAQQPSYSGDLNDYGTQFSDWLEAVLPSCPGGEELPWLPDLARFDWACLQALRAAPAQAPTLSELSQWSTTQQAQARLRLQPGASVLCSDFPLHALYQVCEGERERLALDAHAQGESVLIYCGGAGLVIHRLDPETVALLSLWQKQGLAEVLRRMQQAHPMFSAEGAFARLTPVAEALGLWTQPAQAAGDA